MATDLPTPPSDDHSGDNGRKRVCKACDRCRLKKSKCDGATPCGRCKADNAICVFGERKKTHDKVYPKGYVEMLEQQQAQLVAGLQELYRRTIDGTGWPGAPLKHAGQSQPLTHDILDRLGALTTERPGDPETFEENLDVLQHRLFQEGARPVSRHGSPSTEESAHSHSPSSPHDVTMPQNILFGNQIDMTDAPPTPSTISPTSQVSTEPMDFRLRSQFVPPIFTQANLDPMQLQQPNWPVNYRQKLDTSMNLDEQTAGHFLSGQSAGPCLVPDWNEDEEFRAFLGQIAG